MDKIFKLKEHHTDVKTEILAGLTTFMTMAYVLARPAGAIVGAEATTPTATATSSASPPFWSCAP